LIIIFDSICNLCVESVQFVIKYDKNAKFKFLQFQSRLGQNYLENYNLKFKNLETLVLIRNDKIYLKSDAALEIAKHLDGKWKYLYVFKIIPRFLRDAIYMYISRNRYKFFGKKDICMTPSKEIQERFLDKSK